MTDVELCDDCAHCQIMLVLLLMIALVHVVGEIIGIDLWGAYAQLSGCAHMIMHYLCVLGMHSRVCLW